MIFQKVKVLNVKAQLLKFGPKITYKGEKGESAIKLSSDNDTCVMVCIHMHIHTHK